MLKQTGAIAYYTLLEALRNRLVWLVVAVALAALGMSGFLAGLALTESVAVQASLVAAFARLAAVFILATFVVTSMAREISDKGLELVLALALPRAAYLTGKLCGYGVIALLPALLFALSAVMAFYFGARSITAFQAMGQAQADDASWSQHVIGTVFDVVGALLPRLDQFTRTEWLAYHSGGVAELPAILVQTVLCMGVIGGAALFDLYRRNI